MACFTDGAVHAVENILRQRTEQDAVETAKFCFPGMPEPIVLGIFNGTVKFTFTDEGNRIVVDE